MLAALVVLAVMSLAVWIASALLAVRLRAYTRTVPRHIQQQAELTAGALDALNQRIKSLERAQDAVPGVNEGKKDWSVIVDGQRVALTPMTGADWLEAINELPEFVFAYAQGQAKGQPLIGSDLQAVLELAKRWITACAEGEVNLDRLSIPEAEHAVTRIAELNGVTENLRAFFRERLKAVVGNPQDSQSVWRTSVSARKHSTN